MSNRENTRNEVQREFNITIPGNVPVPPRHYDHFPCDCEHCIAYRGTYQVDDDAESYETPELIQE